MFWWFYESVLIFREDLFLEGAPQTGMTGERVPEAGFEPASPCGRRILSPLRMPISPLGQLNHFSSSMHYSKYMTNSDFTNQNNSDGAAPTGASSDGPEPNGTAPYANFEGRVGRTFAGSEPHWPKPATAPDQAPNVIVILCDDLGYSDLGCYGSEISTPHIDQMAAEGLRYTNFHVNPMCSPTRASLLTGLNPHDAGVGHVAHGDPGFPGYALELTDHCATVAEIFRDSGYSTMMLGKWHLCKESDKHPAGNRNSWPLQRGFDQFYGILGGFTNFHHPDRMIEGNSFCDMDSYPDDYYLTDDLTDRAITMIREIRTSHPRKPFFMYLAHPAVHAPLQAKAADIARYEGRYQDGWNEIRQHRYERQKELGLISADVVLPPPNSEPNNDVDPWDSLAPEHQELFARYMEVYAGMVDNVDQNFGRLRAALEETGEWDNTIVLFTSDNGASREGENVGGSHYFELVAARQGDQSSDNLEDDYKRIDIMGGPQTLPHYPRGWAMVGNTPFRLYKINTHAGGHQVPMILSWPAGGIGAGAGTADTVGDGSSAGGMASVANDADGTASHNFRRQYLHVTDVLPTLCEMVGLDMPTHRHGKELKTLAGTSFVHTFEEPDSESRHTEQYYETQGHRGMYQDGWEVVALHHPLTPFSDEEWELFNLAEDPTEANNLADAHPEKVAQLSAAWDEAAKRYQVYPLDEGAWVRWVAHPEWHSDYAEPVTVRPGDPSLEHWRGIRLIGRRSFKVSVSLDYQAGDSGTLFAHGDQGGGYGLYVENGELLYIHNHYGRMRVINGGKLPAGAQEIGVEAAATDDLKWDVKLAVDGIEVGRDTGFDMFLTIAPFQGIDVGIDRRSPVSWDIYTRHGNFPFTGTLHCATWTPGEFGSFGGPEMLETLREMGRKYE